MRAALNSLICCIIYANVVVAALNVVMLIMYNSIISITCCHGVDNVRIRSACIQLSLLFDVVYDVF